MTLLAFEKPPVFAIFSLPIQGDGRHGRPAENREWGQKEVRWPLLLRDVDERPVYIHAAQTERLKRGETLTQLQASFEPCPESCHFLPLLGTIGSMIRLRRLINRPAVLPLRRHLPPPRDCTAPIESCECGWDQPG